MDFGLHFQHTLGFSPHQHKPASDYLMTHAQRVRQVMGGNCEAADIIEMLAQSVRIAGGIAPTPKTARLKKAVKEAEIAMDAAASLSIKADIEYDAAISRYNLAQQAYAKQNEEKQ